MNIKIHRKEMEIRLNGVLYITTTQFSAVCDRVAKLKRVAELDTTHGSKGKLAPLRIPEPLQNEMLSLLSVSVCHY